MPSSSAGKVRVAAGVEALVAAVGVDQARLVQAVAAHHAADGVGDQFLHGVFAEAGLQFLAEAMLNGPLVIRQFLAVAVGGVHREGDLLDGNLGGEFVLPGRRRR